MDAASVPQVSVIIAAYDAMEFLSRAVDSVLRQDGAPVEVVVVDDGSQDGTADLIRELAASDPRVRPVFLAMNRGPAAARNAGVAAARGEWVAVLDADDAFSKGRLDVLLEAAASSGADVVADTFRFFDAATGVAGPSPFHLDEARTVDLHDFLASARPDLGEPDYGLLKPMISTAFLRRAGVRYPEDSRHGEDFLLIVDLLLAGARYVVVPDAGYLYTTRSSGWSRTAVDYAAVVHHSRALSAVGGLRDDPRAQALLLARIRALEAHGVSERWRLLIERRDLLGAARHAARHPELSRDVIKRIRRRLRRLRALIR